MGALGILPLKGISQAEALFRRSKKFTIGGLTLYVRWLGKADSVNGVKLLVTARKRSLKSAVARNRVKRLLREAVRNLYRSEVELFTGVNAIALIWHDERVDKLRSLRMVSVSATVRQLLSGAQHANKIQRQ